MHVEQRGADLRAVLPAAVVDHGDGAPLPVLDARNLLLVKEAGLVSVQFADQHTGRGRQSFAAARWAAEVLEETDL